MGKYSNIQKLKTGPTLALTSPSGGFCQIFKYSNDQIFKYSYDQIFKYLNMQMGKYSNIKKLKTGPTLALTSPSGGVCQIFKYSNDQILR